MAADARAIASVMAAVVAERVYSAVDVAWTPDEQRQFLENLNPREAVHVAEDDASSIVGLQILERWSAVLPSMAHVGQIGTFVLPGWRGRGTGRRLWDTTLAFAGHAGYRKFVIQVRASNLPAQAFYRSLAFEPCGRLTRQVVIDGLDDDEILMERFVHS